MPPKKSDKDLQVGLLKGAFVNLTPDDQLTYLEWCNDSTQSSEPDAQTDVEASQNAAENTAAGESEEEAKVDPRDMFRGAFRRYSNDARSSFYKDKEVCSALDQTMLTRIVDALNHSLTAANARELVSVRRVFLSHKHADEAVSRLATSLRFCVYPRIELSNSKGQGPVYWSQQEATLRVDVRAEGPLSYFCCQKPPQRRVASHAQPIEIAEVLDSWCVPELPRTAPLVPFRGAYQPVLRFERDAKPLQIDETGRILWEDGSVMHERNDVDFKKNVSRDDVSAYAQFLQSESASAPCFLYFGVSDEGVAIGVDPDKWDTLRTDVKDSPVIDAENIFPPMTDVTVEFRRRTIANSEKIVIEVKYTTEAGVWLPRLQLSENRRTHKHPYMLWYSSPSAQRHRNSVAEAQRTPFSAELSLTDSAETVLQGIANVMRRLVDTDPLAFMTVHVKVESHNNSAPPTDFWPLLRYAIDANQEAEPIKIFFIVTGDFDFSSTLKFADEGAKALGRLASVLAAPSEAIGVVKHLVTAAPTAVSAEDARKVGRLFLGGCLNSPVSLLQNAELCKKCTIHRDVVTAIADLILTRSGLNTRRNRECLIFQTQQQARFSGCTTAVVLALWKLQRNTDTPCTIVPMWTPPSKDVVSDLLAIVEQSASRLIVVHTEAVGVRAALRLEPKWSEPRGDGKVLAVIIDDGATADCSSGSKFDVICEDLPTVDATLSDVEFSSAISLFTDVFPESRDALTRLRESDVWSKEDFELRTIGMCALVATQGKFAKLDALAYDAWKLAEGSAVGDIKEILFGACLATCFRREADGPFLVHTAKMGNALQTLLPKLSLRRVKGGIRNGIILAFPIVAWKILERRWRVDMLDRLFFRERVLERLSADPAATVKHFFVDREEECDLRFSPLVACIGLHSDKKAVLQLLKCANRVEDPDLRFHVVVALTRCLGMFGDRAAVSGLREEGKAIFETCIAKLSEAYECTKNEKHKIVFNRTLHTLYCQKCSASGDSLEDMVARTAALGELRSTDGFQFDEARERSCRNKLKCNEGAETTERRFAVWAEHQFICAPIFPNCITSD